MARRSFIAGLALTALAACSAEAPESAAPVEFMNPPVATRVVQTSEPASPEQLCREAVRILYGQEGAAVAFNEDDFSISWHAPVDGGRLTFACSFVGSQVTLSHDGARQTVDVSAPAPASAQEEAR